MNKTPDIGRHEAFEAVRVEPRQLVARTEAGEEHVIPARQAQAFDVYQQESANPRPDPLARDSGPGPGFAGSDRGGRMSCSDFLSTAPQRAITPYLTDITESLER
jgi:hypothetical protein